MRRGTRASVLMTSLILTFGLLSAVPSEAATYKISIRLSASTIRSDRLATVSGSVAPRTHGGTVSLYRYQRGWHLVKSTGLNRRSSYAISFAPPRPGTFDYRVVWQHVRSRIVRLIVREAPPVWTSCREGKNGWEPDFPIGSVIRTNAYLYPVPIFFFTDGKTYPFTLKSIAYRRGSAAGRGSARSI